MLVASAICSRGAWITGVVVFSLWHLWSAGRVLVYINIVPIGIGQGELYDHSLLIAVLC